ncbi:MAG: hypothetical protein C0469_18000 [Cyanobacteria bacterium DS2.3.42]|nr:hypothetical protein [Cyanobacteria bacterium DS2.3.42]
MTLQTYDASQHAYAEPRETEESFDSNVANEDPSAALLEASGAYLPSFNASVTSAETTSFEPPVERASMDPCVSVAVSDAGGADAVAEEPEEKEDKSGILTTFLTIGVGMLDQVINHPLQVLGNVALGVAVGAAAAVVIPALGVVGTGVAIAAAGVGAYQLVTHADDWFEDGAVIANADQYSAQEVAAARENLIGVGHETTNFVAGAAGGFVGSLNSVFLKESVEAGGALIADSVRGGAGTISEYVAPLAKKISGAADFVMTKTVGYSGVVGNAVNSVSTPVIAKGAQVAGIVSDKVGAVAQPMADKAASVTLSVGEKVAPYADKAASMAANGGDKAATLISQGLEKVTSVASVGADKTSRVYLTVADSAKAQATTAMDFASPYVDKVAYAATSLRDRAMDATKPLTEKIVNQAALVKENIFLSRYMRSAERALAD